MKRAIEKIVVLEPALWCARIGRPHVANAGVWCALLTWFPPEPNAERKKTRATVRQRSKVPERIVPRGLAAPQNPGRRHFFTRGSKKSHRHGQFRRRSEALRRQRTGISVVAENLEIKRALLARSPAGRKPGAYLSHNTSGLGRSAASEGLPENGSSTERHALLQSARYLKLVETFPGHVNAAEVHRNPHRVLRRKLGQGVVVAKDTPIYRPTASAPYSMLNALRRLSHALVEAAPSCRRAIPAAQS